MSGPTLVKFPTVDPITARRALQNALDRKEPLTNVIILSQLEDGSIYHEVNEDMEVATANWMIDNYKRWLQTSGSD